MAKGEGMVAVLKSRSAVTLHARRYNSNDIHPDAMTYIYFRYVTHVIIILIFVAKTSLPPYDRVIWNRARNTILYSIILYVRENDGYAKTQGGAKVSFKI